MLIFFQDLYNYRCFGLGSCSWICQFLWYREGSAAIPSESVAPYNQKLNSSAGVARLNLAMLNRKPRLYIPLITAQIFLNLITVVQ